MIVAAAAAALLASSVAAEPATLSMSKGVAVQLYGFVETDLILDTRQGFVESQANNLVPKDRVAGVENFAGRHHRAQMSVRQSRFGLAIDAPEAAGWKTKGVLELDFYGNNGTNAVPGSAPGAQTERDFYNNPAVRVRHAYAAASRGGWSLLAGQFWSLFGWQTEYFPPEITVQATVGQLNSRMPQLRAEYSRPLGDGLALRAGTAVARPNAMNSGSPVYQAAARLSSSRRKAGVSGGYATPVKELSAGVGVEVVPLGSVGKGNPVGTAVTFQTVAPILAAAGDSPANTLAFVGELVTGSGVGGVELPALTFGVPGPTAAQAGYAVDAGLAGINAAGNLEPIRFRSFRGALSYVFPDPRWGMAAGYAQVEGRNLDRFSTTAAVAAGIAPKLQYGFVNVVYAPFSWLRFGAQGSQTRDTYNDSSARFATNNRLQLSAFFVF